MKTLKNFLKYWLTLSSMAGFLAGWVFVSQSAEAELANPVSSDSGMARNETVALPPVPSLDSLVGGQVQSVTQTQMQPFTIVQSQTFQQPQMRTGGS